MIRVLIPCMPSADDVLPYLRRIDRARMYSNGGPLLHDLNGRLTSLLQQPARAVSTGTAALELSLRSLRLPSGSPVLLPSVTFIASGLAALNAGLRPVIMDVHPRTWQLDPETAAAQWFSLGFNVGAIMPVAAFGMPVDIDAWRCVAEETGAQVVIDAAGALVEQAPSSAPQTLTCYSLHATKFIGAGEGGVVCTVNEGRLKAVEAMSRFGDGGTNAKLSEYHAAVALASMEPDAVQHKHARTKLVADRYTEGLRRVPGIAVQRDPSALSTMLVVKLPRGSDALLVADAMAHRGVETKRWYSPFLHDHPALASYCAGAVPVASALAQRLLGLPFHPFMSALDVTTVCGALHEVLALTTAV